MVNYQIFMLYVTMSGMACISTLSIDRRNYETYKERLYGPERERDTIVHINSAESRAQAENRDGE